MADDPIIQMASDPDFPKMPITEQQKALAAHDPTFGKMDPVNISAFVQAHQARPPAPSPFVAGDFQTMPGSPIYNTNRLGSQPLTYASMGAAISGAKARGQLPDFPQQVQQAGAEAGSYAPAIGAAVGAELGPPGMAAGAGIGEIAKARMQGQPSSLYDAGKTAAITYASAMGIGALYKYVTGLASNPVVLRMSGATDAAADAIGKYEEDLAQYKSALQDHQQQVQMQKARIAAPPSDPQQELWTDLNKSLQVKPGKVRVKLGAEDLSSAVSMPGRGLAQEGLKAVDLAAMTPIEQNAAIAPKWNAAGQAVDAAAAQATKNGTVVNLYKLDEAVDRLVDPNARQGVQKVINRVGESLGIRNWGQATPTQALALRRALWEAGSNGEYVSRAVSDQLRDAVPDLRAIDQHYTDLNGAMTTVRDNLKNYAAQKFQLPKMWADYPKAPTAPTPPDLQALQDELVKKFGWKVAKGAGAAVGAGTLGKVGFDIGKAMLDERSSQQGR